jgi:hypothetical protein
MQNLLIFFEGESSTSLTNIKSKKISEWIKSKFDITFTHIRKDESWRYGFVHFKNETVKNLFFNIVKNETWVGPKGKIFKFGLAKKACNDDDNDNDDDSDNNNNIRLL